MDGIMVVDLQKESIGFYKEFLFLNPLFRFVIVLEFCDKSVEVFHCSDVGFLT